MKTPRTIPIKNNQGKREYVTVNDENGLKLDYDSESLKLRIETGVSFEMQRAHAYQMIMQLMKLSPEINEYIAQGQGIEILLDNIDIRGIDKLKAGVQEFVEEKKKQKAEAMQAQQQQQAQQAQQLQQQQKMGEAQIQQMQQLAEIKAKKELGELKVKEEKLGIDYMLAESKIDNQQVENVLKASEIDARNARTDVDLITRTDQYRHTKAMDLLNLHNKGNVDVKIENEG
jgi:hypothetical protein